jgi:hypothetical protein
VTPRLSLNRWLADMFWDYREPRMSRDDFLERYMIRITADELSASLVYDALVNSLQGTGANDTYFGLASLNRVLRTTQDLSPLMTISHHRGLTVSTIHKAKGREFDHVYLLSGFNPSDENTAEARVWYVGSTRPKSRLDPLEVSKKLYVSKPTEMNRRVLKGYAFNRSYCSRIVIGLPDDINNYSFIEGDLHHALDTQQYLSTSVELNDAVELVRMDNLYRVIHNGTIIGSLRPETTKDFWAAIRMTGNKKNIPPRLMEIYVSNIITVVPRQFPSGADAMFKESGFWLGIELTGFAKVDWDYGGVRQ